MLDRIYHSFTCLAPRTAITDGAPLSMDSRRIICVYCVTSVHRCATLQLHHNPKQPPVHSKMRAPSDDQTDPGPRRETQSISATPDPTTDPSTVLVNIRMRPQLVSISVAWGMRAVQLSLGRQSPLPSGPALRSGIHIVRRRYLPHLPEPHPFSATRSALSVVLVPGCGTGACPSKVKVLSFFSSPAGEPVAIPVEMSPPVRVRIRTSEARRTPAAYDY
jgi:hypothetical protein